jgi:hypothetical protein
MKQKTEENRGREIDSKRVLERLDFICVDIKEEERTTNNKEMKDREKDKL